MDKTVNGRRCRGSISKTMPPKRLRRITPPPLVRIRNKERKDNASKEGNGVLRRRQADQRHGRAFASVFAPPQKAPSTETTRKQSKPPCQRSDLDQQRQACGHPRNVNRQPPSPVASESVRLPPRIPTTRRGPAKEERETEKGRGHDQRRTR
uniref:Uncharacterized protein n=1 Tax=Leersia perrieri TaxID=77586 RepID=A0A0D9WTW4_9ORYZ